MLCLNLVLCKSHPAGTGFEDTKGSLGIDAAQHCERPWMAIGESATSVEMYKPGLKGSCKGVEAWHHEECL